MLALCWTPYAVLFPEVGKNLPPVKVENYAEVTMPAFSPGPLVFAVDVRGGNQAIRKVYFSWQNIRKGNQCRCPKHASAPFVHAVLVLKGQHWTFTPMCRQHFNTTNYVDQHHTHDQGWRKSTMHSCCLMITHLPLAEGWIIYTCNTHPWLAAHAYVCQQTQTTQRSFLHQQTPSSGAAHHLSERQPPVGCSTICIRPDQSSSSDCG